MVVNALQCIRRTSDNTKTIMKTLMNDVSGSPPPGEQYAPPCSMACDKCVPTFYAQQGLCLLEGL